MEGVCKGVGCARSTCCTASTPALARRQGRMRDVHGFPSCCFLMQLRPERCPRPSNQIPVLRNRKRALFFGESPIDSFGPSFGKVGRPADWQMTNCSSSSSRELSDLEHQKRPESAERAFAILGTLTPRSGTLRQNTPTPLISSLCAPAPSLP